jgi:hypothetical protein
MMLFQLQDTFGDGLGNEQQDVFQGNITALVWNE